MHVRVYLCQISTSHVSNCIRHLFLKRLRGKEGYDEQLYSKKLYNFDKMDKFQKNTNKLTQKEIEIMSRFITSKDIN